MVSGRVIPGISLGPRKVNIDRYSPSDRPFSPSAARLASSPSAASCLMTCARESPESSAIASYRLVSFFDRETAAPCQFSSPISATAPKAPSRSSASSRVAAVEPVRPSSIRYSVSRRTPRRRANSERVMPRFFRSRAIHFHSHRTVRFRSSFPDIFVSSHQSGGCRAVANKLKSEEVPAYSPGTGNYPVPGLWAVIFGGQPGPGWPDS